MAINIGEALLSFIGGAAPGYVQGRQDLLERRRTKEKEAKEEQRLTGTLEKEQEQKNKQLAGRKEMFGLLTAVSGISPQTPASEIFKIKSQYLDAADRAGLDLKTANVLFDDAAQMEARQPVSPLDAAKLETEKATAQKEKALAGKYSRETSRAETDRKAEGIKTLLMNRLTDLNDFLRQGTLDAKTPQGDLDDAREERAEIEKLLLRAGRGEAVTEEDLAQIEMKRTEKIRLQKEKQDKLLATLRALGLPETPGNLEIARDVLGKMQRGGELQTLLKLPATEPGKVNNDPLGIR